MLQKFKITSCAFILVLFGFSLMTVSPVLAVDAEVEDMTTAASSQEAFVDDAQGTKEALKLQIEVMIDRLLDKDARIADLQEQLSTAHSESEAQVDLIAGLESQLATAIERADELLTGQDEVGRTQSSTGLRFDEARALCSYSDPCQVIPKTPNMKKKYDVYEMPLNYQKLWHDGEAEESCYGPHDLWMVVERAGATLLACRNSSRE
jgi:chromosome condensin MukBEF ATPase and DNA-binding subunit MukB